MADGNGSNSVAIVAIIILVLVVLAGVYYFVRQGNMNAEPASKIEVNVPSTSGTSTNR